jgi:hypothetical protein
MTEQNELLRSAYQIAQRQGAGTNWEAFANNLRAELVKQSYADINDEQQVLRATCTPKTYFIRP